MNVRPHNDSESTLANGMLDAANTKRSGDSGSGPDHQVCTRGMFRYSNG